MIFGLLSLISSPELVYCVLHMKLILLIRKNKRNDLLFVTANFLQYIKKLLTLNSSLKIVSNIFKIMLHKNGAH